MKANNITLTGKVVVTQGTNVLRGDRMVVDLTTGVARVESNPTQRVEGLFNPGAAPQAAPAPAPPPAAKSPPPAPPAAKSLSGTAPAAKSVARRPDADQLGRSLARYPETIVAPALRRAR